LVFQKSREECLAQAGVGERKERAVVGQTLDKYDYVGGISFKSIYCTARQLYCMTWYCILEKNVKGLIKILLASPNDNCDIIFCSTIKVMNIWYNALVN
jgi:hypothetical protein